MVVAAVFGPKEPRSHLRELPDRAFLEESVRPRVRLSGAAEKSLEGHVLRQVEHLIVKSGYPRTTIQVRRSAVGDKSCSVLEWIAQPTGLSLVLSEIMFVCIMWLYLFSSHVLRIADHGERR